jgi:hypothetical protein
MTFMRADGRSSSAAHDLLALWLSATVGDADDRAGGYQRCAAYLEHQPAWDAQTQRKVRVLILHCLRSDAARLPQAAVLSLLTAAAAAADGDPESWRLIAETARAALPPDGSSPAERAALLRLASRAL